MDVGCELFAWCGVVESSAMDETVGMGVRWESLFFWSGWPVGLKGGKFIGTSEKSRCACCRDWTKWCHGATAGFKAEDAEGDARMVGWMVWQSLRGGRVWVQ